MSLGACMSLVGQLAATRAETRRHSSRRAVMPTGRKERSTRRAPRVPGAERTAPSPSAPRRRAEPERTARRACPQAQFRRRATRSRLLQTQAAARSHESALLVRAPSARAAFRRRAAAHEPARWFMFLCACVVLMCCFCHRGCVVCRDLIRPRGLPAPSCCWGASPSPGAMSTQLPLKTDRLRRSPPPSLLLPPPSRLFLHGGGAKIKQKKREKGKGKEGKILRSQWRNLAGVWQRHPPS